MAVLHEGDEAGIRQALAVGKRQTLNASTDSQSHDAAVVDPVSKRSQIKAPYEIAIVEVGVRNAERLADGGMLFPAGAGGAVPEDIDRVASPSFAGQHYM